MENELNYRRGRMDGQANDGELRRMEAQCSGAGGLARIQIELKCMIGGRLFCYICIIEYGIIERINCFFTALFTNKINIT